MRETSIAKASHQHASQVNCFLQVFSFTYLLHDSALVGRAFGLIRHRERFVMIKSGLKKAYVFSRANAIGAWASEGEEFMGWQIRSINGAGAKLEQGRRSIELKLYPRE
jgi:hypothetical protein